MDGSLVTILAFGVPLIAALLVALTGRWPNLRETITLLTGLIVVGLVASLYPTISGGERVSASLIEVMPGISLAFDVEPLGLIYALLASVLWFLNSIYAIGYMRGGNEPHQTRFYTCFCIAISAAIGIAFASNLFTLFVFYEILTFSTYPLVTHKGTPEARRAGRIYLGILLFTSTCMLLLAILWTWSLTGTMDFKPGGILGGRAEPWMIGILFVLFVLGTGKAALMPFHFWLPAAMVAPTPVSSFLHAVAVVKAGVFIVLKIVVYVIGTELITAQGLGYWLMYLAGATILIASLVAMTRDNLKARLAYSTVSQLAYITLGAALANELGIIGGSMHMVMHGFGKITLFFCAGAIYVASHKTNISEMSGLGRKMPLTFFAFFVASLSIIGMPPMGGLWSKWYLALGTLEAGQWPLLVILLVSSLLNVAYLLPIPIRAFFGGKKETRKVEIQEAPVACLVPLTITSVVCVVLFIVPGPLERLAGLIGKF